MPFKKNDPRARESRLRHYRKNREQYYARNKKKIAEMRSYLNNVKSSPCTKCGQAYPPYVMDFHHIDPATKVKTIAALVSRASWNNLKTEVNKCVLLCSNCHRIETHRK